jgi:hypothetical protein
MRYTEWAVQDGSINEDYAKAEGIKLIAEYSNALYCRPYTFEKLNPKFPEKGVTIRAHMGLKDEKQALDYWSSVAQSEGQEDYYQCRAKTAGQLFTDCTTKLLVGVLQLESKYIELAYRRLAGEQPADGLYSRRSLLVVGGALWNPWFVPGSRDFDESWLGFISRLERAARVKQNEEARRQAAIADFLGELG